MRQQLRNVWEDLSHGKHLATYPLMLAAVALSVWRLGARLVAGLRGTGDASFSTTDWMLIVGLPLLALLLGNALGTRRLLEGLGATRAGHAVTVLENWHSGKIAEALGRSRKSVVILSSWLIEPANLGDSIRQAASKTPGQLTVDLFMLDPERPLGAERYGEIFPETPAGERARKYHLRFEEGMADFLARVQRLPNVTPRFLAYPSMPEIKLYAVDDEHYFFSWLMADGHSTNNVCLYVSARNEAEEARWVVAKLRHQIEVLRQRSRLVPGPAARSAPGPANAEDVEASA